VRDQFTFEFYRDELRGPWRPTRPERLIFMAFPDSATAIDAVRLARQICSDDSLEDSLLTTDRLHVSLHHIGDYVRLPEKYVFAARQAAETIAVPQFEVTFDRVASFAGRPPVGGKPARRPMVLLGRGGAILELHRLLGDAMRKTGLKTNEHFVPHMTLFYGPKAIIPRFIQPISWIMSDFSLIHSERGLGNYIERGRWLLN
jgi:RNA 2',3'-cyclic 3'-phosphodiesterase